MALHRATNATLSLRLQRASATTPRAMSLVWEDDTAASTFHAPWLYHQCPSFSYESGQRLLRAATIPLDVEIETVEQDGDDIIVDWTNGHRSFFDSKTLYKHRYSHLQPASRRPSPAVSGSAEGLCIPGDDRIKGIAEFDCRQWLESDAVLREGLEEVARHGAVMVTNTPADPDAVLAIGERVSAIQNTIYGRIFEVASQAQPINVAYSTIGLDLHCDLAYLESPPGLQLLHCLQFDDEVVGGDSQLMDGFRAAEYVYNTQPHLFEALCTIPHTLQKVHAERDNPVHMVYRRPHVTTDFYGRLSGMFWAPPFEGPLRVPSDYVELYFEAYVALGKAMEAAAENHQLQYRMREGDTIVFNNRRMLHGRSAFASPIQGKRRVLRGCYINIDEFLSRLQHLNTAADKPLFMGAVGNQDYA